MGKSKGKLTRKGVNILQLPMRGNSRARRERQCPFSGDDALKIDYKDVRTLQRFTSEQGKMIPSRLSSVSPKKQRLLAQAIKRARFLALMPYVVQ